MTEADEKGEKHVILCQVMLGEMERIEAGSEQFKPSSGDYDSGVDDLQNPRFYVVWSENINQTILPEFIVSFTSSHHQPGTKFKFIHVFHLFYLQKCSRLPKLYFLSMRRIKKSSCSGSESVFPQII